MCAQSSATKPHLGTHLSQLCGVTTKIDLALSSSETRVLPGRLRLSPIVCPWSETHLVVFPKLFTTKGKARAACLAKTNAPYALGWVEAELSRSCCLNNMSLLKTTKKWRSLHQTAARTGYQQIPVCRVHFPYPRPEPWQAGCSLFDLTLWI